MGDEKNLVSVSVDDLAGLAKPAQTAIEKFSDAISGWVRPWQLRRTARAESDVAMLKAQTAIALEDIQKRAVYRHLEEETNYQRNLEAIADRAAPMIKNEAQPQNVEPDWFTSFFQKARLVSDEEMQILWARILAGEANSPGAFSRKTLSIVNDMDKKAAHLFEKLRSICVEFNGLPQAIVTKLVAHPTGVELRFSDYLLLEALGLVTMSPNQFLVDCTKKTYKLMYYGSEIQLQMPADKNAIPTGYATLTHSGEELILLCSGKSEQSFIDIMLTFWEDYKPKIVYKSVAESEDPSGA